MKQRVVWISGGVIILALAVLLVVAPRSGRERILSLPDGEELAMRLACLRCHEMPETGHAFRRHFGPTLDPIGGKLRTEWTAKFLADPDGTLPGNRMPKIDVSKKEITHLVAFLRSISGTPSTTEPPPGDPVRGKKRYARLGCTNCHGLPGVMPGPFEAPKPARDLANLKERLHTAWVFDFLSDPKKFYPDTVMPDQDLSERDRRDLIAYLFEGGEVLPADTELSNGKVHKGAEAFVKHGCAACHPVSALKANQLVATGTDLGPHRRGGEGVPRIRLTYREERALFETLSRWLRKNPEPKRVETPLDPKAREFLASYFEHPISAAADDEMFTRGVARSLSPAACGVCHPIQYFDWKTSIHADAVSIGYRAEIRC